MDIVNFRCLELLNVSLTTEICGTDQKDKNQKCKFDHLTPNHVRKSKSKMISLAQFVKMHINFAEEGKPFPEMPAILIREPSMAGPVKTKANS